jgi:hypothetical protein
MITLTPFGNISEAKEPIGYVWHRNTGWRILIVIDDWFDIPIWDSYNEDDFAPSSHAYGLTLIRDELAALNSTRAIGFFALPDPQIETFNADIQKLIDEISKWVLDIKDDNAGCKAYIIVDYYYGEGFNTANEAGTHFVGQWKTKESLLCQKLAVPIKLSHSSIGGGRKTSNPYNLEVFKKTEIYSTRQLPIKLRKWLDVDENPIFHLWRESRCWFLAGRDEDDIMKHTKGNIQEYLNSPEDGRLSIYRQNVESALGMTLPDSWWQDSESLGCIHESLKCLCGAMFCGECNEDTQKRPISAGAAFLVALIAHHKQCGNITPFIRNENLWSNCHRVATSFVFAKQDRMTAQSSTLALYHLFCLLFEVKDRSGDSADQTSQVNNVLFGDEGRFLRIELAWHGSRKAIDEVESLAERTTKLFQDTPIKIPAAPPQNTREAVLRLWSLMAINEEGCFAPGIVHLNKNMLIIGSVM